MEKPEFVNFLIVQYILMLCHMIFIYLFGVYIQAISMVLSGPVPTCDSTYPRRFYSAAPLGYHAAGTVTRLPLYYIILILI